MRSAGRAAAVALHGEGLAAPPQAVARTVKAAVSRGSGEREGGVRVRSGTCLIGRDYWF